MGVQGIHFQEMEKDYIYPKSTPNISQLCYLSANCKSLGQAASQTNINSVLQVAFQSSPGLTGV